MSRLDNGLTVSVPAKPFSHQTDVAPAAAPPTSPEKDQRPGGGLTFARGSLETMYGRIATDWRIEGDGLSLDVTVPPNTTATIHVPAMSAEAVKERGDLDGLTFVAHRDGAAIYEATAGRYGFTSELPS